MNVIVGDNVVLERYARTGTKFYVVKILSIDRSKSQIWDQARVKVESICNAITGKKRKTKFDVSGYRLTSLEVFLDNQRAFIKEMEQYL